LEIDTARELEVKSVDPKPAAIDSMRLRLSSRCRGLLETSFVVSHCREALPASSHEGLETSKVTQPSLRTGEAAKQLLSQNVRVVGNDDRFASLTTLPLNARQFTESTNTPECRDFISTQATAKYYLKQGKLPDNAQPILEDPIYLEDMLHFMSMWLSQTYGGNIMEWIHMILVIRQDINGAPQLDLMLE
jgi:hypothetical protein